ncbi:hypothetical protein [Roseibium sp.]|uniref:hypothetical protein n=1 Tax=Roseibium sp. TaxID=1936156 RepID=UPI003264EC9B
MMSAIVGILGPIAAKVGAGLVKDALSNHLGKAGGELAGRVIDEIAIQAGVRPEDLSDLPVVDVEDAIRTVEGDMPQILALWSQGLDGQFALLQAEQAENAWQSGWRWGWMYLLGLMWFVRLMVVPVVDVIAQTRLGAEMNIEVMLTLTSWFLGLYMGGHTLKAFGAQIAEAVKGMRRG